MPDPRCWTKLPCRQHPTNYLTLRIEVLSDSILSHQVLAWSRVAKQRRGVHTLHPFQSISVISVTDVLTSRDLSNDSHFRHFRLFDFVHAPEKNKRRRPKKPLCSHSPRALVSAVSALSGLNLNCWCYRQILPPPESSGRCRSWSWYWTTYVAHPRYGLRILLVHTTVRSVPYGIYTLYLSNHHPVKPYILHRSGLKKSL